MPGKPGNTNALKHGLYAKRFTNEERKRLKQMPPNSIETEIALLRVIIDRAADALEKAQKNLEPVQPLTDPAAFTAYAKILASHTAALIALNTLIRTHALLTGDYNPIDQALDEALDAEPFYPM
jgi:hypothetical protein